ncbi:MAG: nonstructural protein [Microvirus sp.]|nr:MAG: nonstructural protein [Microvirus sp.]
MHNVYAVYDKLAETIIGGLHLMANDASAIRFFSDIIQEANSRIAAHPDDYSLISLGEVEYTNGRAVIQAASFEVVSASAVLATLNAQKEATT